MNTATPQVKHTAAAIRLAGIIIPEGIDSRGYQSRIATAYGKKTRESIADLIDNESGAPELLEACKLALKNVEGRIFRFPASVVDSVELLALRKERDTLKAAITKATTAA